MPISYDAQGNPTRYLGHTLTWEKGRQLKSFDGNSYAYNANGIRTSKTANGVKHTYTLDGTKILRETWTENTLVPMYDNEDSVCGIIYNDEPYYFQKNLQGDIIGIVGKNATVVAKYSYDAWGTCTIIQDISECSIATVNPYRYRCYYYDSEIQMYYLQSRYYDPRIGRFVNVDTSESLQNSKSVLENNLFAYCQNDPVNESDYTGSLLTSIIRKILTGLFKGFIGQLGMDFISFLYKIIFVNHQTKLTLSSTSEYLQAIASAVISELVDFFGGAKLIIEIFTIIGPFFVKLVQGNLKTAEWIHVVIKVSMLILKTVLFKRLNAKKKKELNRLKKYKQKKPKNKKSKNKKPKNVYYNQKKRQVKLEYKKKGFKINLKFDITDYVIDNFFNILISI